MEYMNHYRIVIQEDPPAFIITFNMPRPDFRFLKAFYNAVRNGLCLPRGSRAAYKKIIAEIRGLAYIQCCQILRLLILCTLFDKK